MFNGEQRVRVPNEDRMSLALIIVAALEIYAGLSTAVAGFVLDITALVIAGLLLVCFASLPISRVAQALNKTRRASRHAYERGEQCESLHPSLRPSMPSIRNSAFLAGSLSIKTASIPSPTRPTINSGSMSTSIGQ